MTKSVKGRYADVWFVLALPLIALLLGALILIDKLIEDRS